MILNIIFAVSGLGIAALIGAKIWEDKHRRKPFFLRLVSMGDEHVRTASHELAHRYAEWKDDAKFFVEKQLPLHAKNFINKTHATIKERAEKHIGDIRGSRFLKKNDGLNEFFKSISEKENGGRIDDSFEDDSQEGQSGVK